MSDNPKGLLICGGSGDGKSTSLRELANAPDKGKGVLYINAEGGKPLPFKHNFKEVTIDDPYEVCNLIEQVNENPGKFHTIIIDTISFLMNRFESVHVIGSSNTMAAWGDYGQFFPSLMYDYVAKATVNVIMLGHLDTVIDDAGNSKSAVPVKGALARNGLEAYFTTVINARKVSLKEIAKEGAESPLLNITKREESMGFKHVFQTQTTAKTLGDRIRSPFGLFSDEEVFIDNDITLVIKRLQEYYAD